MPASRRCRVACWALAWSRAPLRELQRRWTAWRLDNSDVPPCIKGRIWSALFAPGLPHIAQSGLPCRTMARLVRYCLVEYSGLFAIVVFLCLAPLLSLRLLSWWEFRRVVPPRFQPVWLWPPCVNTDTIRVLEVRTLTRRLPQAHFRMFIHAPRQAGLPLSPGINQLHSSIPYERMHVFSYVEGVGCRSRWPSATCDETLLAHPTIGEITSNASRGAQQSWVNL
jgi:hypothetical protein